MALIQGNYPATVKSDPKEWADIYRTHMYLTGASIEHQPDVIVWPRDDVPGIRCCWPIRK